MWHVSTDHEEFFHTPEVRDISYRRRRTPKHSLSRLPHSVSIIDTLSCWKASQTFRWSVWWIFQLTNRPPDTLHQNNVVGEGLLALLVHIQLLCYLLFVYLPSILWVSSFVLTVQNKRIWIHSIMLYFTFKLLLDTCIIIVVCFCITTFQKEIMISSYSIHQADIMSAKGSTHIAGYSKIIQIKLITSPCENSWRALYLHRWQISS